MTTVCLQGRHRLLASHVGAAKTIRSENQHLQISTNIHTSKMPFVLYVCLFGCVRLHKLRKFLEWVLLNLSMYEMFQNIQSTMYLQEY